MSALSGKPGAQGGVSEICDDRTHEQSMAREHLRICPFLLWQWLLAQLFAQVALEEGMDGICYIYHDATYEIVDACWGEEL